MEENKEVNGFSPLFDPIYIENVNTTLNPEGEKSIHVLNVSGHLTKNWSIQILKQNLNKSLQIKNINEAVKYILNNVQEEPEIDMYNVAEKDKIGMAYSIFFIRASNGIAINSRRGCGNIAIVGKQLGKVLKENKNDYLIKNNNIKYKNYEYIGLMNNAINIFVDKTGTIPENKAIIAYNGEGLLDKGLFLTLSENKDFFYLSTNYGNWTDYFKVLSFNIPKESIIDKIKNKFKKIFKR